MKIILETTDEPKAWLHQVNLGEIIGVAWQEEREGAYEFPTLQGAIELSSVLARPNRVIVIPDGMEYADVISE